MKDGQGQLEFWPERSESCESCGSVVRLEVHHIDGHHDNNAPENRMVLCQQCHASVHRTPGVVPREKVKSYCQKDREKQARKKHLKELHVQSQQARREAKLSWDRLMTELPDRAFDRGLHLMPPD